MLSAMPMPRRKVAAITRGTSSVDSGLFGLELFHILLNRERKRAERSGRHFVLIDSHPAAVEVMRARLAPALAQPLAS